VKKRPQLRKEKLLRWNRRKNARVRRLSRQAEGEKRKASRTTKAPLTKYWRSTGWAGSTKKEDPRIDEGTGKRLSDKGSHLLRKNAWGGFPEKKGE